MLRGDWEAALPEGLVDRLLDLRDYLETAHEIPGRLRLRLTPQAIARLPKDQAKQVGRDLQRVEAIRSVRLNIMARSVVIEYDAKRISAGLWRDLIHGSRQEAERALEALADIVRKEGGDGLLDDRG